LLPWSKIYKAKCKPLIIKDFPKVEGRGSQFERVRVSTHPTKQNKCYTQLILYDKLVIARGKKKSKNQF
jgi:hypothetical protein